MLTVKKVTCSKMQLSWKKRYICKKGYYHLKTKVRLCSCDTLQKDSSNCIHHGLKTCLNICFLLLIFHLRDLFLPNLLSAKSLPSSVIGTSSVIEFSFLSWVLRSSLKSLISFSLYVYNKKVWQEDINHLIFMLKVL